MHILMSQTDRAGLVFRAMRGFASAAPEAEPVSDLPVAIGAWSGFDHSVILKDVDFGRIVPGARLRERTGAGSSWVPKLIPPGGNDHIHMAAPARFGPANGIAVANDVPGESFAARGCSVATNDGLPRENHAAAQGVGAFGCEAARRLAGAATVQGPSPGPVPPATIRPIDAEMAVRFARTPCVGGALRGRRTTRFHALPKCAPTSRDCVMRGETRMAKRTIRGRCSASPTPAWTVIVDTHPRTGTSRSIGR